MLTPIEFSNLYNKKWTEEFNLISNTQLKDTWEVLATAFNDCIKLNKKGEVIRLVVPMPTGSGKSTGLELYLQNLDNSITALVVVYFIETADELEKRINEVNPNSAIAVHSKNENTNKETTQTHALKANGNHIYKHKLKNQTSEGNTKGTPTTQKQLTNERMSTHTHKQGSRQASKQASRHTETADQTYNTR